MEIRVNMVLNEVTLICIDCYNYSNAILALKKSMEQCSFAAVKFLTDIEVKEEGVEGVKIDRINSKEEYSEFCIKELYKYFDTDFVIICQHDGYIINGEAWTGEFLEYDYIGSPWDYKDGKNVGNGAASLRSKKLQTILGTDDFIFASDPEDQAISRLYRDYLIKKYNIKYAPEELADKWGFEMKMPTQKTFMFHSYFHLPFKDHIILRREASLGDLIMLEPIIDYYAKKGLQVVIDTNHEFMQVFSRYRHRLLHISQMDSRISPIKRISFDMAYEIKPKQSVIKSYVEITGENIPFRNSRLDFHVEQGGELFHKYILIHVDETGLTHRNCQGVNWAVVVPYYQRLGYQVFQTGKRMKEQVAPFINLSNIEILMYMIKCASLLIGIDSSPAQMAVALGTPAVIFFGSVDSQLRYSNFEKVEIIHSDCKKPEHDFCYHSETGTTGVKCRYNIENPPCVQYTEWQVVKAANKLLKLN